MAGHHKTFFYTDGNGDETVCIFFKKYMAV